jgi:small subunit ribosomal protein S1
VEAPGVAAIEPEGRPDRRRGGRARSQQRKASLTEEVMKSLEETRGISRVPRPSARDHLSPELEEEFQQAVGDVPLDALMSEGESVAAGGPLEPESRHTGRIVAIQRDDVFVELGGKEQGTLPVSLLSEPPQVGAAVEVVVVRFNAEDGLYELTLPGRAFEVGDWSQVAEGMLVEARVTGHNAGGLECEVSRIRGFIPISQIALYRVENLEEFKDQKLTCLVTEANPSRRNLVLSRRAVLEREREEARKALFESLAPGQIREGVVSRLMDFGAFVDLGGVEGLLHISQMAWGRIGHPREVLQEGQTIRVRIDKVNPQTGKISLGYREMLESPWTNADGKYLINTVVRGRVVKIMDFGAFVELEPGVEGLVHISEVSHKRVGRVSDVVKEGEDVDVMVLSVDKQAQRISLSMKAALRPPEPESSPEAQAAAAAELAPQRGQPPPPPKPKRQPQGPLQGGLGRSPRGQQFGLKW